MSTALSATGRITVPVIVSNFTHKVRVFVRNPQAVGGSFNINSRATDANDQVWTDALNDFVTTISWMFGGGATFADAILEHQTGGIYTTLATATPSFVSHVSGTPSLGWQTTWVFRDLLNKQVKLEFLEGYLQTLTHVGAVGAFGAGAPLSFLTEFLPTHTLTHAPYVWMVSRGNQYLNTAPFVGLTVSTNKRIRRRRGLT